VTVHLVGAGPGDPGLITARGLDLLRRCEVLVYDRLVAAELVDEAPPRALRIAREQLSQREVNEALVAYGRAGLEVVRLKGGDPFVFGRGGEEALALTEAGVPFQVVPGVSALAAVPAAAGIPVTHRDLASQATIVSGHAPAELDYQALAALTGTLIVFMGLAGLDQIVDRLLEAGKDPNTPAAVISNGTTPEQRTARGTLAEIPTQANALPPPALLVIGEVAALAAALRPSKLAKAAAAA
jgi:uroporphyrinogen III methyltransferase/synthase